VLPSPPRAHSAQPIRPPPPRTASSAAGPTRGAAPRAPRPASNRPLRRFPPRTTRRPPGAAGFPAASPGGREVVAPSCPKAHPAWLAVPVRLPTPVCPVYRPPAPNGYEPVHGAHQPLCAQRCRTRTPERGGLGPCTWAARSAPPGTPLERRRPPKRTTARLAQLWRGSTAPPKDGFQPASARSTDDRRRRRRLQERPARPPRWSSQTAAPVLRVKRLEVP